MIEKAIWLICGLLIVILWGAAAYDQLMARRIAFELCHDHEEYLDCRRKVIDRLRFED